LVIWGGGRSLDKMAIRSRRLLFESLEPRELLTVSTGEFNDIRSLYADLHLSANMADYNIIEITAAQLSSDVALRSAITTAATTTKGDLIVVRTTALQNSITLSGTELSIGIDAAIYGSVTIVSLGTNSLTIDANQQSRVLNITAIPGSVSSVGLGGLTITGGYASFGGGIRNAGNLTVVGCVVSENYSSGDSGGIGNLDTLTLTNSTISDNTCYARGGGVGNSGILTATNCIISLNATSLQGGGVSNQGGTVTLTDSLISKNSVIQVGAASGGGIFSQSGGDPATVTVTVTNCVISENYVQGGTESSGGGIYSNDYLSITNSVIRGNDSNRYAGGIYIQAGKVDVTNTVISGNAALLYGAIEEYAGSSTWTNCTIAGNITDNSGSVAFGVSSGSSAVVNNTILFDSCNAPNATTVTGSNNLVTEYSGYFYSNLKNSVFHYEWYPLFVNITLGDYRLAADSSAVNAGSNALAVDAGSVPLAVDLDGQARIYGGTVDIGAYECSYPAPAAPQVIVTNQPGSVKLDWAVIAGADQYEILRQNSDGSWTSLTCTTALQYVDTDATPNVAASYIVRAYKGTSVSGFTIVYGKALFNLVAPVVTVTNQAGSVKLDWAVIAGADKYEILRQNSDGSWTTLAYTTTLQYVDTSVTPNVATSYIVRSCAGASVSGFTIVYGRALPNLGIPQVAVTNQAGGVKLTWGVTAVPTGMKFCDRIPTALGRRLPTQRRYNISIRLQLLTLPRVISFVLVRVRRFPASPSFTAEHCPISAFRKLP